MYLQNISNLIGLLVGMIGSYLMYANSPKVQSGTYIYTTAELIEKQEKDTRKNKLSKLGIIMLFFAFLFQSFALLMA